MEEYIAYAIPFFFVLIALEVAVAWRLGRKVYRLNDALTDLACGALQQVLALFTRAVVVGTYEWLWTHARLWDLPSDSVLVWVACFLGVDFFYYWFHRVSHERALGWGAHIVHHQSDEYNLAVALRQGAFQPLVSWVFYLPLALAGFPPVVFLVLYSANILYQFWIHTRLIGKLGPLEWVLNTPSHHRVHHASDPHYWDRNYAGTLIVWDRLFGTFVEEREEPTYGVTEAVRSWNPVWANFHYYALILGRALHAQSPWDAVKIWFMSPGWRPGGASVPLAYDGPKEPPFDARPSSLALAWATSQTALAIAVSAGLLLYAPRLPLLHQSALALFITWTFVGVGGVLESRHWARASEVLRLLASVTFAVAWFISAQTHGTALHP